MSNKSYQNNLFKRIIDLGRVTTADVDDLVRIWRVGSGDEKAITLANFVATVNADLGSGGSSLTELIEALQLEVGGKIGGSGTPNYIPKFTASGTIGDSRLIDDSNGVYNTDKDNSTFFGYQAGLNDDAFDNRNAGFGYQAMSSITSGTNNVAFGYKAMSALTNGISNTAIGQDSMELATNINYAVAIGDSALRVGNGAYNLVAIGVDSARNATTAASFVAVGRSAGLSTTTGQGWTAIGDTAGSSNTTGQYWTALGGLSGFRNATGSSWITLGYFAGAQLASLANATSFSNSIYIGNYTKVSANGVTNEIVIGDQAVGNGSNTVTIGNSSTTKNYFFGRVQHGDAVNSNESATLGQVNSIVGSATFIGLTDTPASYTGQAGLFPRVNSGETGLEFFNPLSLPITGYTVGSNTALASTDTILGAFGKVQGQINDKIGGTIASGQVAFGTGVNTIGGDSGLTWDNVNKRLGINITPTYPLEISGGDFQMQNNSYLRLRNSLGVTFRAFGINSANIFFIGGIDNGPTSHEIAASPTSTVVRTYISGVERTRLNSTGLGVFTNAPTNTLDVNGDARIRTLSNATGDFVTASATGVLQKRTASETLADIGGIGGTIASGQVAFGTGTGTIGGDSGLTWNNTTTPKFLRIGNALGEHIEFENRKLAFINSTIYPSIYSLAGSVLSGDFAGTNNLIIQGRTADNTGVVIVTGILRTPRLSISGNGLIGLNTTSPTNTLDVNGTARIRTLSNATGDFVTASATGVLQKRTASETLADIGGIGGTIASGQVAFGTASNTIGGDSGLAWDNVNKRLGLNVTPTTTFDVSGTASSGFDAIKFKSQFSAFGFLGSDNSVSWISSGSAKTGSFIDFSSTQIRIRSNSIIFLNISNTELARFNSVGQLGIATTSPTNTLDVNGTARIRTLSNATGDFVTASATGVLQKRTASETLADIGGIGGTIASGQVAFGTGVNTIGGNNNLAWDNANARLTITGNQTLTGHIRGTTFTDLNTAQSSQSTIRVLSAGFTPANRPSGNFFVGLEFTSLETNNGYKGQLGVGSTGNESNLFYRSADSVGTWSAWRNVLIASANTAGQMPFGGGGSIVSWTSNIFWDNTNSRFGVLTTSPTDTLDVDGTARIRTLSNATGDFVTASATGVLQKRTASETLADIGAIGGTIASGQVAFGTGVNTIGGDSGLTWDNVNKRLGIGTSSPTRPIHLEFASSDLNMLIKSTFTNSRAYIRYQSLISGVDIDGIIGTFFDNQSLQIRSVTNHPITFHTNNIQRAILTNTGSFGIATTSPTNTLDVNGTARIRTLSNATGDFVTASATGVLQKRTAAEVATDIGAVTITGTQTITGEKTFSNSLLIQEASAPILRLKTTAETQATINFRNSANEDEAGLQFDAGVGKFSLLTRTNNCDIEIAPHGTGSILLPNVPSGSGDVLMLNGSGEVVKGSGTPITEQTGYFTPTLIDIGGGATYSASGVSGSYYKHGSLVYVQIIFSAINTTGTPTDDLAIDSLPFPFSGVASGHLFSLNRFEGSSLSSSDVALLTPDISSGARIRFRNRATGVWVDSVTLSGGGIIVNGIYTTT